LVFSDDFNEFDLSVWEHELTLGGGGSWEFEHYTNNRSNSYVRDSILYLKPTLTSGTIGEQNVLNGYTMDIWGASPADVCTGNAFYGCSRTSFGTSGGNVLNPIQSARVRTARSFSFKYGKVEVRAKLPKGDWIWPAIWMLPRYNSYGSWPSSGEVDIVESRGNANYAAGGVNSVASTLHWGPFVGQDPFYLTHGAQTMPSGDFSQDFHVFGMIWTNDTICTYIDSESNIVLKVDTSAQSFWHKGGWDTTSYDNIWANRGNNAPFDQKFYLIFNVAVGGTGGYFPDGVGNKPWSDTDPHAVNAFNSAIGQWYPTWNGEDSALQIDYVKVWDIST
jgi:beta-glucanase (GH16 family)